jgi:hypothetical protein
MPYLITLVEEASAACRLPHTRRVEFIYMLTGSVRTATPTVLHLRRRMRCSSTARRCTAERLVDKPMTYLSSSSISGAERPIKLFPDRKLLSEWMTAHAADDSISACVPGAGRVRHHRCS